MATRKGTITWFAMMIGIVFVRTLGWARFPGNTQDTRYNVQCTIYKIQDGGVWEEVEKKRHESGESLVLWSDCRLV